MAKRHNDRGGSLEAVIVRLEELVLANSGEDAFEEIFKLLIAKIWSEKTLPADRFQVLTTPGETYSSVCRLLVEANNAWSGVMGDDFLPRLTHEHMQVCVQSLARHRISGESFEVLDSFFEFLVARTAKESKGQFFTPRYVIDFCVRMLRPTPDALVLDPACGSGGFLIQTLAFLRRESQLTDEQSVERYCKENLWGFDLDAKAVRVAKVLMLLAGGDANIIRLNSLLPEGDQTSNLFEEPSDRTTPSLTIEDICRTQRRNHRGFDVILTNPPFAGEVRERAILDGYSCGIGKTRVERDVLFIERCVRLLKPGGRMAIVLPQNKFAADGFADVRAWLLKSVQIQAVVGLGRNTFMPHTHQKTSVLFVRKHMSSAEKQSPPPIFFAVSEREGKNSKGQLIERDASKPSASAWERIDHDLDDIVRQYHAIAAIK